MNANTIDKRASKLARNSVFNYFLSPDWRQMAINNSVSDFFLNLNFFLVRICVGSVVVDSLFRVTPIVCGASVFNITLIVVHTMNLIELWQKPEFCLGQCRKVLRKNCFFTSKNINNKISLLLSFCLLYWVYS